MCQDGLERLLRHYFGKATLTNFPSDCIAGAVARQVNTGAFPDRLQLFDTRMDISYDVVSILKVAVINTRIYGSPRSFLAGLGRCSGVV